MTINSSSEYLLRGEKKAFLILGSTLAALMTAMSGLGLAFPAFFYPSPEIGEMFLTNDLVNILIGLPFFMISLGLIKRDRLMGALLFPGALIYVIYNYFAYLLGKPWQWSSVGYLVMVLLSGYGLFHLLRSIDHQEVKERLEGGVSDKISGWVLVLFGLAFIALAFSEIIPGILDGSIPPLGEKAVSAADILVSLGWVIGGILLLGRKAPGYTMGLGFLLAASSLFIGLILFFFIAPLLTDRPFDWIDVLTVFLMGLICFVPTALFCRGVVRSENRDSVTE